MWNSKKIFWHIYIAALILGTPSCTNVQTKNQDKKDTRLENRNDPSAGIVKNKVSEFFLLPSPGEIIEQFYSSEIKYNSGLLNSPANKDKYIGSKAQSLNLGVYITDMAYSALFERSSETVRYLETIQSLSLETGISSTIFETLLKRSKANAGKMDSLLSISNDAFNDMKEFLESGGKENTIARISAGAYIESLYIALQSMNKFSESSKIAGLAADMKYPMDNLLEMTKKVAVIENDSSLYKSINQISVIFNKLDTKSSETKISQKQPGMISISGGNRLSMNETEFNKLRICVTEIRKNIVGK